MPIQNQNSASVTVNAVLVPQIVVSTQINAAGKLVTSARALLQGAQVTNAGQANESWAVAGQPAAVQIPDVANLAGNASTADLAAVQAALNAAMTDVETAINAINAIRKLA